MVDLEVISLTTPDGSPLMSQFTSPGGMRAVPNGSVSAATSTRGLARTEPRRRACAPEWFIRSVLGSSVLIQRFGWKACQVVAVAATWRSPCGRTF